MKDSQEAVKVLIDKAKDAKTADEAMKLTQAALNAANAICALEYLSRN